MTSALLPAFYNYACPVCLSNGRFTEKLAIPEFGRVIGCPICGAQAALVPHAALPPLTPARQPVAWQKWYPETGWREIDPEDISPGDTTRPLFL